MSEDISVVVSVYSTDRARDLERCIESVKKQTLRPKEIIVVLDPNEDLIAFYRERLKSDVKIIVSDRFGLSSARNAGVRNSKSEIMVFIDDDAVADERWLGNLVRNYDDPSVIGVGGRIEPLWDKGNPSWFPEELYWIVGCSYKGLPTKKAVIRNPIGCNMSFRRSVFEKVGYFSTIVGRMGNNLMGHDDTEFGIRATSKLPGTKILYDPEAVVFHRVSKDRITLKYVMKRSYAEGFSKAFVSNSYETGKSALDTEKNYLQKLFLSTPSLVSQGNARTSVSRFSILWVAAVMVLMGYFVGSRSR